MLMFSFLNPDNSSHYRQYRHHRWVACLTAKNFFLLHLSSQPTFSIQPKLHKQQQWVSKKSLAARLVSSSVTMSSVSSSTLASTSSPFPPLYVSTIQKQRKSSQLTQISQNVTSSSTVVAALEAARDNKAPVILQFSQGGAAYFAGKGVSNTDQAASIAGSIAAAHYVRSLAPTYGIPVVLHTDHCAKKLLPWLDGMLDADEAYFKEKGEPLFSSHMIDLSEEPVEWNIETTAKYLKRAAPMKQWLEMEIGITGGEEDGVNNEDVDNNSLYTQPEDILNIYNTLSPISPYFSIAAGFGNVHGVYKPGNVKLHPELLGKHQAHVKEALKSDNDKPVFFVFHGGSGSSKKEYLDAIGFGVVKVNVDTDMQFAYCSGIRDYMINKREYVNTTVGNPDGEDKPNKKYFDPRVWVREGEKTMSKRVAEALQDFNTANQL
ncbi:fructose-bisphosphate aldolase, class II [Fusarium oxysporum f. sp. lycopersici 4287]|uniref:Fructose-bisphosphate aldolase n=7 Tax=Fusarium oxysporum TaxID=5507 RepID=A0A0J9VFX8_FUSO4|nr:fructose-bisphosphate aldolase, class II [Fusarium oxysporum f. sp. lycopersici 4287]EXK39963.1 fructose-bisphosphate aldolase, class II [Fusarium oxysporum f. sp. melonis 26406]KNB09791.1 fructose-bisphosphate aldolase, class II [Fusarium oxysporum f. sp. lycopersici 4287]